MFLKMNKYVVFPLLMTIFVTVLTAEDLENEEVTKPEYDSQIDTVADSNSYEISNDNYHTELDLIDKIHTENEKSGEIDSRDNIEISRSSKDDEATFTDKLDIEDNYDNRRDYDTLDEANFSKSDEQSDVVAQNEDNSNENSEPEDTNYDTVFRNDEESTIQVENRSGDTETVTGDVPSYDNDEDRTALSDEPEEFVEFSKTDNDEVTENTRRMLSPVQVVPTLLNDQYPLLQTLESSDDSFGNYVAASPPKLQLLTSAQNLYKSPVVSPIVSPVPRPDVSPVVSPVLSPIVRPDVRQVVRPDVSPIVSPVVRPDVSPIVSPVVRPDGSPIVNPILSPVVNPAYPKVLAKTPLINTIPRQDPHNLYGSYFSSVLNRSSVLTPTLPTKSPEYYSFEDKTDGFIENNQNMYPFSPYEPTTVSPDIITNYILGRADMSHDTYRPVPYYTQLFKPLNQRYGTLGYGQGQYTVTRYRRDVRPGQHRSRE